MSRNYRKKNEIRFVHQNINSHEDFQRFFHDVHRRISHFKRCILLDCCKNEFHEIFQHQIELKIRKLI